VGCVEAGENEVYEGDNPTGITTHEAGQKWGGCNGQ